MICLAKPPCDAFAVDPNDYNTSLSGFILDKLRYLEQNIRDRTFDFLQDPQFYIQEWENITDELIPDQYVQGIPQQIVGFLIQGRNKKISDDFIVEHLPVMSPEGEPLSYPEDRLIQGFLPYNHIVYVLKDSVLKQLIKK